MAKGSTKVTISLEGANSAVFTVESDYLKFGRYRQTGEGDNPEEWNPNAEEWEPQPIEWQILDIDTENNRALLLSRYGLDAKAFDDEYPYENVWSRSSICSWLNGDFYNTAFDDTEKGKINPTKLSDVDSTGATYNVFLLSEAEANNTEYFADDTARQCLATAYAVKNGAYVDEDNGYWWLSSPYPSHSYDVYYVLSDGSVGYGNVGIGIGLVRPALWINL